MNFERNIMEHNSRSLIDAILSGDEELSADAFDSVLADKLGSALESERIRIAGGVYNTIPVDEQGNELEQELGDSEEVAIDSEE